MCHSMVHRKMVSDSKSKQTLERNQGMRLQGILGKEINHAVDTESYKLI